MLDREELAPPAPSSPATGWSESPESARAALIAFTVYEAIALPLLLFVFGSFYWFARDDDWGLLVGRSLGSFDDLVRPQHQHWLTVPVITHQLMYQVFGLRSYLPYQLLVVLLHLTLAALLRVVMRRAGVHPWIATVAAGVFVLYGTGEYNILSTIQVGMVGSLVLGLTQMLLADHDGGFDWRDGVALVAGLLALMSSGTGPIMVAVVGAAVLLRRGWRAAALQTVPLGVVYLWWYLAESSRFEPLPGRPPPEVVWQWVRAGESAVFMGIGQFRLVAVALGLLTVAGLVLAWSPLTWSQVRRLAAEPSAMLGGALLLFAFTSVARWDWGEALAEQSRYVATGTALTLPAIAVAGDAFVRRWRVLFPVVIGLLLVGVPGNISRFGDDPAFAEPFYAGQRRFFNAVASSPLLDQVDPEVRPDPNVFTTSGLTAGFLAEARRSGRLPPLEPVDPALAAEVRVRLSLLQREGQAPPAASCRTGTGTLDVRPRRGDTFVIPAGGMVVVEERGGQASPAVGYNPAYGNLLRVTVPDLHLVLSAPGQTLTVCS